MEFVKNYKLEENNDGYILLLYLDIGLTEFADEFGSTKEEQVNSLDNHIWSFIKNRFPNIKINSVKLMVGSMVIANIMLHSIPGFAQGVVPMSKPVFNMTYAYFETGSTIIETLSNTGNILDVVSPTYFDLNQDGSLKITEQFDPNTIKEMQKRNFRVVPFLGNHWDRAIGQAALRNKDVLIEEIASVISEYNLDGIHVDIENLTPEDKEEFTLFIKGLRDAIPKDKEVSLAVAANPKGYTSGWYASYDYEKLAQYADYLMVMSYDEHYDGGEPGPISSVQFVEDSIKYLLQNVPPDKIVIGLPFFGRSWKDDGSIKGKGTSLIRVDELIKKYNGSVSFDDHFKSPKATINITGNEADMPKGEYTIWFENGESILNKLELINKYNLKGAGSWSLHQATEDIWKVYNQWSDNLQPNEPLTRAQAATLLVQVLELAGDSTNLPQFIDVPTNHWAKADIEIVSKHGLMKGKGNQSFFPNEFLTREETAVLLSRLLDISPSYNEVNNPFKDIDKTIWSYPYIVLMVEEGILEGYEDQTFRPKDSITRAEMVALLDKVKDMIQ